MDTTLTGPVWATIARTGIVIERAANGWAYDTGIGLTGDGFVTAECALEYALLQLLTHTRRALGSEREAAL